LFNSKLNGRKSGFNTPLSKNFRILLKFVQQNFSCLTSTFCVFDLPRLHMQVWQTGTKRKLV